MGKSGMAYCLDKAKLCRLSPNALTDAQTISYIINGLAKWEQVAAMTANPPANVPAFIARIRELEQLGITARPEVTPAVRRSVSFAPVLETYSPEVSATFVPAATAPPSVDLGAAFLTFGDRLITELSNKLEKLTIQAGRDAGRGGYQGNRGGYGGNRGGGTTPSGDSRGPKCYACQQFGHIARHCPGNESGGQGGHSSH